jgi:hypothetical protein
VNINAEPFPDPDVARCRREVLTAAVISTLEFTLLRKPPKAAAAGRVQRRLGTPTLFPGEAMHQHRDMRRRGPSLPPCLKLG